jgi:predicted RNase H-like nuclease
MRAQTGLPAHLRPRGSLPNPAELLASASKLCDSSVKLVAIDMPLAHTPIVGRRFADDKVSQSYGARKCGTHTPSALRPGRISDDLRAGFEKAGYPLLTKSIAPIGVIEVCPHPALVELAKASKRLPYKASRVRVYWPSLTPLQRRSRLSRPLGVLATRCKGVVISAAVTSPPPVGVANARIIRIPPTVLRIALRPHGQRSFFTNCIIAIT